VSKAKVALAKCIGPFCTDFNTRKIMGYSKESLAKKNVFPQKYDEIRRLDGTYKRDVDPCAQ
jgi:hypothetical protein